MYVLSSVFNSQNQIDARLTLTQNLFKGSLSEEWHGNGVERFTTKDGTTILAITHRADSEAVIFKDPFTYPSAQGGGSILQRRACPPCPPCPP